VTAPDAVVIGGGISGLTDAILLAESGRKVVLLERHGVPGGYLQQFTRKRTRFDVGFHYLGSTEPGRPMRQFLQHLRVWERLRLLPFPEDAAIVVQGQGRRFAYPTRWARFRELAAAAWPDERAALQRFCDQVDAVCREYKWFDLRRGRDYAHPLDLPFSPGSLAQELEPAFRDPWLRQVLGVQSFNLGLLPHEVPWVKHALAFRSNFDLTSRLEGGGGALVAALVERGRELGVEHRLRSEVTGFRCAEKRVRAVRTARGDELAAGLFVAACHPKPVLRLLPDEELKPVFKVRTLALRESRGAVQVWLRLRGPCPSLGASCWLIEAGEDPPGAPPLEAILVTQPTAAESPLLCERGLWPGRGHRVEAMTYLEQAPFARWRHLPAHKRGPEYEALKADLAARVVRAIARVAPELPGLIEDVYAATPLTDEHYTRNEEGGVFGISHDVAQQGTSRPQPRSRLKNLWFTGHSLQMPGICGVFINAFHTCELIRGDGALFEAVAT
jgi:phytoene dehydrogenase-like protein